MDTKKEHIFIVRCGEVALKGMNKPYFERMLVERIKKLLKKFDGISVKRQEGLIFVRADGALNKQEIIHEISKVFGVASISPAVECESTMESIGEAAVKYMLEAIEERGIKTFKVEAKRADKNFPVKSPEIGRQIGAVVLKGCKVLKVDVHHPDCPAVCGRSDTINRIYTRTRSLDSVVCRWEPTARVCPCLSGGIDSPVATWMMAKRGMMIEADPFPFLSRTPARERRKRWKIWHPSWRPTAARFKMHVINLLPIQEQIVAELSEEETTILVQPVHDADRTGDR